MKSRNSVEKLFVLLVSIGAALLIFGYTADAQNKDDTKVEKIEKMVVWGNHSSTQYPDISYATVDGEAIKGKVDDDWNVNTFIPLVQQRGAAIIKARGASSAASAASAAIDHMRDWTLGSNNKWVSMGVYSAGNSYGIEADIIYSFPIVCENGEWKEISGLEISDFSRERLKETEQELLDEKAAIVDLLR